MLRRIRGIRPYPPAAAPFYPADKALIFAQAPGEIGLQYAFFPPRADKRLDENRVGF